MIVHPALYTRKTPTDYSLQMKAQNGSWIRERRHNFFYTEVQYQYARLSRLVLLLLKINFIYIKKPQIANSSSPQSVKALAQRR